MESSTFTYALRHPHPHALSNRLYLCKVSPYLPFVHHWHSIIGTLCICWIFFNSVLTCSYNRYSSLFAYGQSKLANVLHANELARRFKVLDLLLDKNEIGNNFMAITNWWIAVFFQTNRITLHDYQNLLFVFSTLGSVCLSSLCNFCLHFLLLWNIWFYETMEFWI